VSCRRVPLPAALAARAPRSWRCWESRLLPYLLLLPVLVTVGLVLLYPIVKNIWLSFHTLDYVRPQRGQPFVGLANYRELLASRDFWLGMGNTAVYTLGTVAGSFLIGLGTALLLNERFRGRWLARTLTVLPWAIPYVAAVLIWTWIMDAEYGVLNFFLVQSGLVSGKIPWLASPAYAMAAVLIVTIWKQFPFATVMLLAGLQAIPDTLYEAAHIDGAGKWRRFVSITLPGLRSVTAVVLILLTIWAFRRFAIIYVMTGGGPARATETLPIQTYLEAFRNYNMGTAASLGTVSLVISMAVTLLYLRVLPRSEEM
jgi:ABC-type sugar transport system permease subunit